MITKQKHVLIAEDDVFLLQMMQKAISSHGVRVSTAENGQKAIDLLKQELPDLLLLDLLMPQVDGFAVLKYRKENNLKIPVVVCSNLSDRKSIVACSEFDVAEYLIKSDMDDQQIWTVAQRYLK